MTGEVQKQGMKKNFMRIDRCEKQNCYTKNTAVPGKVTGDAVPKVSVIMPVYHMAKQVPLLKAAIESIKNQTYPDWELIICDDGSTDQTVQALRQMIGTDDRIRLICSHKNRGAGYTRNVCIHASAGEYLAVMDADDISHPQRLEKQVAFLTKHPQYALVGCNAMLLDGNGVWGTRILEEKPDKESFLHTLPFVHPSIMLRREVVQKLHGYTQTEYTRRTEDYEFLMRLYACGYKGYNIQEPLLCYREDLHTYQRWKYRFRIEESMVRCQGFLRLGILKGNFRYVLKPLFVGLIPISMLLLWRRKRYQKVQGAHAGRIWKDAQPERKTLHTQKAGGQGTSLETDGRRYRLYWLQTRHLCRFCILVCNQSLTLQMLLADITYTFSIHR